MIGDMGSPERFRLLLELLKPLNRDPQCRPASASFQRTLPV